MPRFILMRHAKSDWADASLSDHERPLNDRGRRDAPMMGQWMVESGFVPDQIIHSTALRCVETVDLMVQSGLNVAAVEPLADLYLASAESTLRMIDPAATATGTVMLVGHNPGFSILATKLASDLIEMPTASVCVFEFNDEENKREAGKILKACLLSFMRPKTILKERNGNEQSRDG